MADVYQTLYNPDVLSCLANLSNDEVFTPPEVANRMLDLLPQELFRSPDTTFLDPACKSGVFLREIAKRLLVGLENEIPDLQQRVDHIFHKQLYGIAITELTSLLSRRSVYCSKYPNSKYSVTRFDENDSKGNIEYERIQHRWKDGKCMFCGASESEYKRNDDLETHAYEFIHTIRPENIFDGMKFDVIIGNPPYQLSTSGDENGAQAKPIYQLFVNQAIKLNARYVVMITPSWWFAGGWGLDDFRTKMINCNSIKEMHDYPISTDCFAGVQIKGGVSYFLYDKNYSGMCEFYTHDSRGIVSSSTRYLHEKNCDVLIRDNELIKIFHRVQEKEGFISFAKYVTGRSPFGFNTNHHGSAKPKSVTDVPYYERTGYTYMPDSDIKRGREYIHKYKIYISKAYGAGEGYPHQIINRPILGEAGTICSGTYLMVGPFATKTEAENALAYMCTKFFRALVAINKISQDASYKVYEAVPDQDFSVLWTDEMLYDKYDLSTSEIDYIESIIKPMELGGDE